MDPPEYVQTGQHLAQTSAGWAVVTDHRPSYMNSPPLTSPTATDASAVTQLSPTILSSPFCPRLITDMPYPDSVLILPAPRQILKSQSSPVSCAVCRKPGCSLLSHKHFAEQSKSQRHSRRSDSDGSVNAGIIGRRGLCQPVDSFMQYPLPMDKERHQLLSLWSQDWGRIQRGPERHLFPVRWIDLVLPFALKHVPLFQTLLATAASMWALTDQMMEETASRHVRIAVEMLSPTWANSAGMSSDEFILAHTLLTLVYLTQGNQGEADRTYLTLAQAVSHRGGPHYLGISGIAAELLLYADASRAVLLNKRPTFKLPLPALDVGLAPRLGSAFRVPTTLTVLSQDLVLAADSLCRATDIFQLPMSTNKTVSGPMNSFGYLSTISEYQLARCNAKVAGTNSWTECICLALLLFNHVVLRSHGTVGAISRKIEGRLWIVLDAKLTKQSSKPSIPPSLLFWALLTGLTTSVYTECRYRAMGVERLRTVKSKAAISTWEDVQAKVLDPHVWMRAAQENTFRAIWNEVDGARASQKKTRNR